MSEELKIKSKEELIEIINKHERDIEKIYGALKNHAQAFVDLQNWLNGDDCYEERIVVEEGRRWRTPVRYVADCWDDFMDWF